MSPMILIVIVAVLLLLAGGFFIFRRLRRDSIGELPLPPDYTPIDYTSLPQDDPQQGPSPRAKVLIGAGVLLIVGSLVALFVLLGGESDAGHEAEPTPRPSYTLDLQTAELSRGDSGLQIDLTAKTTLPAGSTVEAQLLEGDRPFSLWNEEDGKTTVEGGNLLWTIPVADGYPTGTRDVTYTVVLQAEVEGEVISDTQELEILSSAEVAFFEGPQPTPTTAPPTPTSGPTATPAPLPTSEPLEPTQAPAPATVVARTAATIYASPYGPSGVRGPLKAGDEVLIVAKLWSGEWYLIVAPATTGWVEGSALPLDGVNVPVAGGAGNRAAVFNGGNIRQTPVDGKVLGQLHAGQTVTLLARNADSTWFRVEAPEATGWVSAALLTIDPAVIPTIPVQ
ncbi:MAG: ligand-binding protein SH3 [Herpetosiphonaceae bacterium]|nr:MAG: ligand-binding protein SH3 [Herpetosiphonaceae bacterium]